MASVSARSAARSGSGVDPETLRLLITVAAPIVAGLGGAAIVFFSAQRVALHTLEAQRQLATDEAVRRWRMEDVTASA